MTRFKMKIHRFKILNCVPEGIGTFIYNKVYKLQLG